MPGRACVCACVRVCAGACVCVCVRLSGCGRLCVVCGCLRVYARVSVFALVRAHARDCTCAAHLPTYVHVQANFTRTIAQWLSAANRSAQLGDLLTAVAGAVDLGVFATNHAPQFIENASDKVRANAIGRALKTRLFVLPLKLQLSVPLECDYPYH